MRRFDRRTLKRPICWIRGHIGVLSLSAGYVSPHAAKPPSSYCERCGKTAVGVTVWPSQVRQ